MKFEDLEVWKVSTRLCTEVYKEMANCKDYGFKDQITRSALSIPSNIAEGIGRDSDKEKVVFLNYSKGSVAELKTQVYIGMEIGYIDKKAGEEWLDRLNQIAPMLTNLTKYLKQPKQVV